MFKITNKEGNLYLVKSSRICDELKFSSSIEDGLEFIRDEYAKGYIASLESYIGKELGLRIIHMQ